MTERKLERAKHICKKVSGVAKSIRHQLSERDILFAKDTERRLGQFGLRTRLSEKQWAWLEDLSRRAI